MREFVKKNSFKRDKIIHKDILGRAENDSHAGKSITIETQNITDKELTDVQKLASKLDDINNSLPQIVQNVTELTGLVNQAAQAAQQAAGIAEGAATTAGEAAQSINEHASSTTNPHPTNVTQEFADTQITPLAAESTYTPTVWSYLVGLFTTVPKSALQHLIKIWGVVNGLAVRVGLLEDNYILKYVVPVDTSSIDLTTDKYGNNFNFVEGDEITVSLWVNPFVGGGNNRVNLRINSILSSNYVWTSSRATYFSFAGTSVFGHSGDLILKIVNKRVLMKVSVHQYHTATTYSNSLYVGWMDIDVECINSITLFLSSSSYPLPAGTVILIKKI